MNQNILLIIAVILYNSVAASNYTDAELSKKLMELGEISNKQCLQQSAYINAAIKANRTSTLVNVPDKPIEPKDVTFLLFTRKNPTMPQNLSATDANALRRSHFSKTTFTYMHIHGSRDSSKGRASIIVKVLLECDDINIIIVDWSSYAYRNLTYTRNVTTPRVGKICSQFVTLITNYGVRASQIHISGHSTGAQAAGIAAKFSKKVVRVTAIDPVGPCFVHQPPSNRLAKTDAPCVQIMHCSVGSRGVSIKNFTGTVDFYLEGGVYQRQCIGNDLDQVSLCSHNACLDYYIAALKNFRQFIGIACENYEAYVKNDCDYQNIAVGGYYAACSKTGSYFVDECPFSHANGSRLQWFY